MTYTDPNLKTPNRMSASKWATYLFITVFITGFLAILGAGGIVWTVIQDPSRLEKYVDLPHDLNKLPQPVVDTYMAMTFAARNKDYEALQRLINQTDGKTIRYTFGPEEPGGAVAHWQKYSPGKQAFFDELLTVLQTEPRLDGDIYVWPAVFGVDPDDITREQKAQWIAIMGEENYRQTTASGMGYMGMRVGIRQDGQWQFYIGED
jgi:hypothetical protein